MGIMSYFIYVYSFHITNIDEKVLLQNSDKCDFSIYYCCRFWGFSAAMFIFVCLFGGIAVRLVIRYLVVSC